MPAYLDEPGLHLAAHECLIGSETSEELEVGRRADDLVLVQSLAQSAKSRRAVLAANNKFRKQRVVVHLLGGRLVSRQSASGRSLRAYTDLVPRFETRLHADGLARRRRAVVQERPGVG